MNDLVARDGRRMAHRARLTRRQVLGGLAAFAATPLVAACAPSPPPPLSASGPPQLPADRSEADKLVRFANWTDYLDYDPRAKSYPTLSAFTKATGIAVTYTEDIDDNDTYFSKIAPQLRAGQDFGKDIVVFSDWMCHRIIRDGLAQPLDQAALPHSANLLDPLKNVSFDPGRRHSLVWQSGFAGLAYNRAKLGRELKAVPDLWAPDLKGRVTLLSEMRDTVGLIMLAQGADITGPFARADIERGFEEVRKRLADGAVRRVKGNSYLEDFKSGNAVAGFAWSGDIFTLQDEMGSDDWQFVMPESGGILWSDNMLIPATSPHRKAALQVMDYYYQPAVAARVAAFVNYICPVKGAQAELEKLDPALAASPFIFPSADYVAKNAKEFRALSPQEDSEYSATWAKVVGN